MSQGARGEGVEGGKGGVTCLQDASAVVFFERSQYMPTLCHGCAHGDWRTMCRCTQKVLSLLTMILELRRGKGRKGVKHKMPLIGAVMRRGERRIRI